MDNKWMIFASGLVAGLIVGVVLTNALSGPSGGGSAPSGAPAPVTPGQQQQQGPDRMQLSRNIEVNEEIVKKDPGNYQAWKSLGDLYFDLGNPAKSIEAYRKALAIKDADPNVWTDMGVMYREQKNFTEAVNSFRKAMALSATHPESRLNLGVVMVHDLNDYPAAIAAWEEFLRVERPGPRADAIRQQLDELKRMAGGATDLDKAAQELGQKLNQPAAK